MLDTLIRQHAGDVRSNFWLSIGVTVVPLLILSTYHLTNLTRKTRSDTTRSERLNQVAKYVNAGNCPVINASVSPQKGSLVGQTSETSCYRVVVNGLGGGGFSQWVFVVRDRDSQQPRVTEVFSQIEVNAKLSQLKER